jgi:heptosyltransferase-2
MAVDNCRNILVKGVNWIGDAVMTMPALRVLKHADPDAVITLLVKPWVSPLFERDPSVDEIIIYKEEFTGIPGKMRLAQILRKHHFCRAVLFQNAVDAAIITLLAGIPERIGYSRDGRRFLLTRPLPFDDHVKKLHHIKYYLNILSQSGYTASYAVPWIYLGINERVGARMRLKHLQRPVVALNPGATYGSSKRWHAERFAGLARRICSEISGSVVIFGGVREKGIADEIIKEIKKQESGMNDLSGAAFPSVLAPDRFMNLCGGTGLRELAAFLSECDVLVTNDSGPMHIGYAVGTPLVALFGSTSPELTGPVGKDATVIRKDVDCAPCFERECRMERLDCMDLISVDEVFNAVQQRIHTKRAVFFDRDGTLCEDTGYLSRLDDLRMDPRLHALTSLKDHGLSLIGITNQSGIARGLVQEEFVREVNAIFIEKHGFRGFYYCPHHPDEHCSCRKPEPGLLHAARADHNIDLKQSFVVGDKDSDMLLARSVGATGILVESGQDRSPVQADFRAHNIEQAVEIILDNC